MNFEEYLRSKKIDPDGFRKAEPDQYSEFERLFGQLHPSSFTAQKLFLINQIRRRFILKEELVSSKEGLTRSEANTAETQTVAKPKIAMRPKAAVGKPVMKPKVSVGKKPVIKPKVTGTNVESKAEQDKVDSSTTEGKKLQMKPKVPTAKKPIIKPKIPNINAASGQAEDTADKSKAVSNKPQIRPKITPRPKK